MNKNTFVFDLDKITEFLFNNEKETSTEMTESYVKDDDTNEFVLESKIIREVKNSDTSSTSTLKYDLLKLFIDTLIAMPSSTEMEEGRKLGLGEVMILNTLVNNGMIKTIKENG